MQHFSYLDKKDCYNKTNYLVTIGKVEKILKGSLDLILSPFSENSNYGRESLLEM